MMRLRRLLYSSVVALSAVMMQCDSSQPSTNDVNKVFPADVGFVNVKTAYGAKGDGVTDDTAALQRAIKDNAGKLKTLYFPNGTYLVSNTLEWKTNNNEWMSLLSLQGQSQSGTIIKLKNGVFTDPASPKAVIKTASGWTTDPNGSGNNAFVNSIYDLTIDTGRGNRGAIGLDHIDNNRGTVENVTIKSGDPNKVGVAGLSMQRYVGPCLIKNVTVTGFNIGIDVATWDYGVTFENITLNNQKVLGFRNQDNMVAIRKLTSRNSVPVIQNLKDQIWQGTAGLVVLVDGNFTGGSSANEAINNESGLYARNLTTSGYKTAIKNKGVEVPGASHGEFTSDTPTSLFPSPQRSLHLPVKETPTYFDSNLSHWKSVTAYGAKPDDGQDDTAAIQAAIDSGYTTIYFPKGDYHVKSTIRVRGKVKHLFGADSRFYPAPNHTFTDSAKPKPVFRFETPNSSVNAVIFERFEINFSDVFGAVAVEDASEKTVVLKSGEVDGSGGAYRNQPGAGRLFLEDVSTRGHGQSTWRLNHPQDVWARQLNTETGGPMIYNKGGRLWILGLKTEVAVTVLETTGGGKTELLGGIFYPVTQPASTTPAIINNKSRFSGVFTLTGGPNYKIVIQETRGGVTKTLTDGQLPIRGGRGTPLYVGYRHKD